MKKIITFLMSLLLVASCGSESSVPTTSNVEPTSTVHVHTYSEDFSYDQTHHWNESTCGHEDSVIKVEHNFKEKVTAPTYEEKGYTIYTCEDCGYSYVSDETNVLEHNYSSVLTYNDTHHWYSCIDEGYEHLKKDEQPHKYKTKVTQPTYENKGYTTYTCESCNYSYKSNETDVLKHNYSTVLSYNETHHWYGCTDKGYEHLKKDEKPHTFKTEVTPSTFENKGYTTYTCSTCKYSYKGNETDVLKHNYSTTLSYNETHHWYDCLDKGYESLKKGEETHTYDVVVTPSTHLEKGYTTYSCKKCDYSYVDNVTELLKYNITYNLDGGTNSPNNPDSFTIEDYIILEAPTKEGYGFLGWLDSDGEWVNAIDYGTNKDIELTAMWKALFVIENNVLIDCDEELYVSEIKIPSGVTKIGEYAFEFCNMSSIVIPNSVKEIDYNAFYYCYYLETVTFESESQLTTIGEGAFRKCYSLKSMDVPSSVTNVAKEAFEECESLETINLPTTLKTLGEGVFTDCSSLKSITLPSGLTSISNYLFSSCSNLTSISIPSTVKTIGSFAFSSCVSLVSVDIPSSVTTISEYAFYYCLSLASIKIPSSVTTIGNYAFDDCWKLVIYCQASSKPSKWSTSWNDYGCYVYWSKASKDVYEKDSVEYIVSNKKAVISGCLDTTANIIIPSTVTINGTSYTVSGINNYAFQYRENLNIVVLPNTITSIGVEAFFASSLESIVIPKSVTSIGEDAFRACWNLSFYCEASSKPSGWSSDWNKEQPIYWSDQWTYDENGYPVPIN